MSVSIVQPKIGNVRSRLFGLGSAVVQIFACIASLCCRVHTVRKTLADCIVSTLSLIGMLHKGVVLGARRMLLDLHQLSLLLLLDIALRGKVIVLCLHFFPIPERLL